MDETIDEAARAAALLDAQAKAEELFVEAQRFVVPGVREQVVSNQVRDLAADLFGVDKHWHKRIVRSGPNTLHPYRVNPPDREITDDDIVFFDFGPVFADWEADFGRTYVVGSDPVKQRLRDDLAPAFADGKSYFEASPAITGAELYAYAQQLAERAGWEFGGTIAGHLVGEFPHERIVGEKVESYIAPGNTSPMRRTDPHGRRLHWILELHFVDREREIGGFYEELLTL